MPKKSDKSGLFAEPEAASEDLPGAPSAASGDAVTRFEDALGELEDIVSRMERGDLPLEESLRLFERGVTLTRDCRQSLDAAELKVRNLLAAADAPGDRDAS